MQQKVRLRNVRPQIAKHHSAFVIQPTSRYGVYTSVLPANISHLIPVRISPTPRAEPRIVSSWAFATDAIL